MNSSCDHDTKKEVAFGDGGVEEEVVWNIEVSQNPGRYSLVIWGCTPLFCLATLTRSNFVLKSTLQQSDNFIIYICAHMYTRIVWQLSLCWILNTLENSVRKLCQKAFYQSPNNVSRKNLILHWMFQARHTQVNLCWIAVPRPLWCTGCQYICQILSKWAPCPPHCPTYPAQIGTDTRAQRSRTILIFAYSAEQSSITLRFI